MSFKTIIFDNTKYPEFQSLGNSSQFVLPFAKHFCTGIGYDIGFNKEEWKLPNAIGIDISDKSNDYHALHLPDEQVNYIYSSHCLEHLDNWIITLEYWISKIQSNGIIFLYLPDFSQKYWRPWNNKKHIHIFTPNIFEEYCKSNNNISNFLISGIDLNNSFSVVLNIK